MPILLLLYLNHGLATYRLFMIATRTLTTAQVIPQWFSFRSLGIITLLSSLLLLIILGELSTPPQATTAAGELTVMENSSQQKEYRTHRLDDGEREGVAKFVLQQTTIAGGEPSSAPSWRTLTFREVASLWQTSSLFAEMFAASLAAVPYSAIFWESIPVTRQTTDKPYEYVTVDSPSLARVSTDGTPFAEYLSSGEGTTDVATFRNMGGDARLIAPYRAGNFDYAHLAAFVRSAPKEQMAKFFCAVGAGLEKELASREDERPVWLSTSGLGVYWLHARLDSAPKYYTYTPYKNV